MTTKPGELRRAAPVTLPAPLGLRASAFQLGEVEYMVLSVPAPKRALPKTLTAAERVVLEGLLGGLSNGQIAAARGVSVRTVANQVAAVLKKSGAASRMELVRKLAT